MSIPLSNNARTLSACFRIIVTEGNFTLKCFHILFKFLSMMPVYGIISVLVASFLGDVVLFNYQISKSSDTSARCLISNERTGTEWNCGYLRRSDQDRLPVQFISTSWEWIAKKLLRISLT